jgi:hypothetical protein
MKFRDILAKEILCKNKKINFFSKPKWLFGGGDGKNWVLGGRKSSANSAKKEVEFILWIFFVVNIACEFLEMNLNYIRPFF